MAVAGVSGHFTIHIKAGQCFGAVYRYHNLHTIDIICHPALSALACALLLLLKSKLVESDAYFVLWLHARDDVSLFPLTG